MEREVQQRKAEDIFDFRKTNDSIDNQMKKVEFTGYKKLAFVSIAFAAFLSVGLTLGNIGVTKYKSSLEIEKLETISQLEQQRTNSQKALENQQKAKDNANLEEQKMVDFVANKIKAIDKPTFAKFIDYLEGHKSFYDDRLKTIRKSLFEAQTANRAQAIDPNNTSKELEVAIVNYKKDLEDVINKTTSIYSSVKDNHVKEDKVNINDMKTFLKLYDQFSNGLVIHNKPIELKIKDILYVKNKANVDYNTTHDVFSLDEKINQEAEKTIKKFKP